MKWESWKEFLAEKNSSFPFKEFISYEKAQKFTSKLGLTNQNNWAIWCKNHKKHRNELKIPSNPDRYYKNKGWKSWKHFLGNQYLPYEEAKRIVHKMNIKTVKEFRKAKKQKKLPKEIPFNPQEVYQKNVA